MLVANNEYNERVYASEATKDKKYYCPICNGEVILKSGDIKIDHFAHKNNICNDKWNYDMSEWHIKKQEYFEKQYQEVVIVHNGEKHRADILKDNMVIEFQHSPITAKELLERTQFYKNAGYNIAWVFDLTEQYENNQIFWNKYAANDNILKWKYPMKILQELELPQKHNKDSIWIQLEEISLFKDIDDDKVFKIEWSSIDDESGLPNYKNISVSKPVYMKHNMNVKEFFTNEYDEIKERLKKINIPYMTKKIGEKGFSRNSYICPKTNEFGLLKNDKLVCVGCPHLIGKYQYGSKKSNIYCAYPHIIKSD